MTKYYMNKNKNKGRDLCLSAEDNEKVAKKWIEIQLDEYTELFRKQVVMHEAYIKKTKEEIDRLNKKFDHQKIKTSLEADQLKRESLYVNIDIDALKQQMKSRINDRFGYELTEDDNISETLRKLYKIHPNAQELLSEKDDTKAFRYWLQTVPNFIMSEKHGLVVFVTGEFRFQELFTPKKEHIYFMTQVL